MGKSKDYGSFAILELARLSESMLSALRSKHTVTGIHIEAIDNAKRFLIKNQNCPITIIGVKNTAEIPDDIIETFLSAQGWIWLTLDSFSEQLAGTDTRMVNPHTGRPMSGSTSGGVINVMRGILDAAIGTDVGGSLIAPALSGQLFAINGKGLGMMSPVKSCTSDGLDTNAGIGFISHSWNTIKIGLWNWLKSKDIVFNKKKILRVCVPARGSVKISPQHDMYDKLFSLRRILADYPVEWIERDFLNCKSRNVGREIIQRTTQDYDLVLTYEGPIDLLGLGDSRVGNMGEFGKHLIQDNGRYLLRSTTAADAFAIGVPDSVLGCGFVLQSANPLVFKQMIDFCDYLVETLNIQSIVSRYRNEWSIKVKEKIPWIMF